MKATLIVMTILGCDHDVSQCQYISTVDGTWPSIAQCDTDSQKHLPRFSNANYPVVVAVCESSGPGFATNDPQPEVVAPLPQPETPAPQAAEVQPTLPKRALAFLSGAVPDREKLKTLVSKPVHYIEDGYSWVARRFTD
ncbi:MULTISPECIES: hypothetical protein [Ensifer]|uniref:hypothetical protein n=1 Tax=Ensifer TaxID=106591 RepID=UPI0009C83DC8|nr:MULTISPECIES: hypothetical protein [Ensifer]NOV14693.1 hypothetical protein [Ensifer canadensis]OMQ44883.1 hypothetical protein BKP54_10800 [Ensifer sp. 1H6]PSS62648.1 hypothetical protein C6558_21940 [Ensifer sp. NM-2]